MYNCYYPYIKNKELNSKSLKKREANRKKATNKFNTKNKPILNRLEELSKGDNDLGDDYPDTPTSRPKPRSVKNTGGDDKNDTRTEF